MAQNKESYLTAESLAILGNGYVATDSLDLIEAITDYDRVTVSLSRNTTDGLFPVIEMSLYSCDNIVSFVNPGEVIEDDLLSHGLSYAEYYLTVLGDDEEPYQYNGKNTMSFTALYCAGYLPSGVVPGTNLICLNSTLVQAIYSDTPMSLTSIKELTFAWRIVCVYSVPNPENPDVSNIDIARIDMPEFGYGWSGTATDVNKLLLEQGVEASSILSATLEVGKQSRTYYIMEGSADMTLQYRNMFNAIDYTAVKCKSTEKLDAEISTAVCNGKLIAYDINNTVSYEVQTAELSESAAKVLMHILCSHDVCLRIRDSWEKIIITERTYEISNADDENYSVKFTYRFAKSRPMIDADSLSDNLYSTRIFSNEYSAQFS